MPVAPALAEAVAPFVGGDLPVRLHAWDGSVAGPEDAPVVELRSPDAVRRLLWRPGELGAAQAYVTGELDVPGDLDAALTHAFAVARTRGLPRRPGPGALVRALRAARAVGAFGARPATPRSQVRAAREHYDLSNDFYELLLDPTMAYSCAYFTDPGMSLEEAQLAKLDLVCQKLGLEPGMRLLDVGCGWGSLSLHAAERYGVSVVGVTISAQQKAFIDERAAARGLGDRVEIRLQDYREVPETSFDAVASLEMGEHVGERNYPAYAAALHRAARPGGRVLVQQMSRRGRYPGGGPFIEAFIAPHMHMRPVGETVAYLERGGLEVRGVQAMREHYVTTVAGWLANFEAHRAELTDLMGEEVVRVWRLYLVGGSMAFRDGRMGVDQILMERPRA
ncbi:cyclopropane-fatty-acyl-phospholipid synthase family protein [Nocardioides aquiterrae]|uniref:Cyclopropane-fatty-acyl-phospholipid synthase family protein n=1 Tax=Nocardioides aquiterrae TaxID=203799 RepID=A0ABN1UND4_9ACTN